MTDTCLPEPVGPGPDAQYRAHLEAGRFAIQRCEACRAHLFPPRVVCPRCGSPRLGWVTAGGEGTVYSATVVRRRPDRGGDYNVAIVELAEGPRMMSRVDGVPPEAVRIGARVRARIDTGGEAPHVVFEPVE